ncbi:hypothetical protein QQS21_000136 [Conoideocrella luteorostrata]|uniref:Uncharacterized protein n=1 Tax=Conoideocrella luteorostrata TaxID=1105319 RepID=A0AAJ0CZR3_9HYPO|nr:hypothetical protein QQS21_000136 [Conoideocrella luteorostrata]
MSISIKGTIITETFNYDGGRQFAAHEKFLIEDALQWTFSRFNIAPAVERIATFGASAHGEFTLAMGLRHTDIFCAIFCASSGAGEQPRATMPSSLPSVFLDAGARKPFFLENETHWAVALSSAGRVHGRARRVARRCVLEGGVPSDDSLGFDR